MRAISEKIKYRCVLAFIIFSAACSVAFPADFSNLAKDARTALDTGRLVEAARLFEKAAGEDRSRSGEISFDWAWTYMLMGHFDLKDKDYEGSNWAFERSAKINPAITEIIGRRWVITRISIFWNRFEAAKNDREHADWDALAEFAAGTASLVQKLPQPHYQLGLAYEWGGQPEKAGKEYIKAIGGEGESDLSTEALREAARAAVKKYPQLRYVNSRPLHPLQGKNFDGKFQTLKIDPFIIYHRNPQLAGRTAAALQYYHKLPQSKGILKTSGHFPRECKIYLYPTAGEYLEATDTYGWSTGLTRIHLRHNKATRATIHLNGSFEAMLDQTLAHELGHVKLAFDSRYHRKMPIWIKEAVAVSAEPGYKKKSRWALLARARDKNELVPLRDIFAMDSFPEGVPHLLIYAESFAMMDALVIRYGEERFWELIKAVRLISGEEALREVYDINPVQLENIVLEQIAAHEKSESR